MNQRTKGHNYEREIVNELNEKGYHTVTSRLMSKFMDDNKVDVIDHPEAVKKIPHHIQCKSTGIKPAYEKIIKEFKLKDRPLVIFHKYTKKQAVKHTSQGEFVIMSKETYYKMLEQCQ